MPISVPACELLKQPTPSVDEEEEEYLFVPWIRISPAGTILYSDLHYRGADKSLARPTSQCFFFDSENISFDPGLVIYIYIYK
jgi:hypothetical protein